MSERVTQRRRVNDEVLRDVKFCQMGRSPQGLTVPSEEAPANPVPAAAVIREVLALFGFTRRKEYVGGYLSHV